MAPPHTRPRNVPHEVCPPRTGGRPRTPDKTRDRAVALRAEGLGIDTIATRLGIAPTTVRNLLKRARKERAEREKGKGRRTRSTTPPFVEPEPLQYSEPPEEYVLPPPPPASRHLPLILDPEDERKQFQLVPDLNASLLYERRHSDCAMIGDCERAWIRENGSRQARCPTNCKGVFVVRRDKGT